MLSPKPQMRLALSLLEMQATPLPVRKNGMLLQAVLSPWGDTWT